MQLQMRHRMLPARGRVAQFRRWCRDLEGGVRGRIGTNTPAWMAMTDTLPCCNTHCSCYTLDKRRQLQYYQEICGILSGFVLVLKDPTLLRLKAISMEIQGLKNMLKVKNLMEKLGFLWIPHQERAIDSAYPQSPLNLFWVRTFRVLGLRMPINDS